MKRHIRYTLFAAAMLLAACAKEDATPAPETGAQLSITVTDGGYAPADAPTTRAAENGYATQFTAGDACGLYIMRDGVVTTANVRLTASATTEGGLAWTPDASLWHTPGDRYFVYYPWQAAPQDAPTAGQTIDADDDAAFFAALIAAWSPAADQSDYAAGYTASDLMTAEATVGPSSGGSVPLLFPMTHRMALAVVELPKMVYTFTDETIPDYTVPLAAAFGGAAQPCRMADHTYRYLVNPDAPTVPTLEGSYDDGTMRAFSIAPAGIAGGSYKTYKVDAETVTKQHTLLVGDYFLSDGHLLTKDADAATVQTARVVGIVFQTDPARIGEAEKTALGGMAHGLVMAVKNAGANLRWSSDGMDEGLTKCVSKEDTHNDISGLGNCAHIRANRGNFDNYPAFQAADEYNTTCSAPETTTGWYLPATGQWYDILRNLGGLAGWDDADDSYSDFVWTGQENVCATLNRWMTGVTGADLFNATNDFWSSSQFSNINARHWSISSDGEVKCCWDAKEFELGVRPVLAF